MMIATHIHPWNLTIRGIPLLSWCVNWSRPIQTRLRRREISKEIYNIIENQVYMWVC